MSTLQSITISALKTKSSGLLLRNVQMCASFHYDTLAGRRDTVPGESAGGSAAFSQPAHNVHTQGARTTCRDPVHKVRGSCNNHKRFSTRKAVKPYAPPTALPGRKFHTNDVRRFLQEVGTDSKQMKYWLNHFQKVVEPYRPFAVIQVDPSVFSDRSVMEKFVSSLSFLQRNDMKCVLVHGTELDNTHNMTPQEIQSLRTRMLSDSMVLVSMLESHGTTTRPFFSGCNILQAEANSESGIKGDLIDINAEPIKWSLCSGHVPIILSIGESETGQLLTLDASEVTSEISKCMQPFKVMYLNTTGGITDSTGEVIPEFDLPNHMDKAAGEDWCTTSIRKKMKSVYSLLSNLPNQTSVVITSASTLLKELFTHHGSGTFFKKSDPILQYYNYDHVNMAKLVGLLNESYQRTLADNYIETIHDRLNRLFISDSYNVAAVVVDTPEVNVPYLDKFAISERTQLDGAEEMLWNNLQQNYKQLFWRSRVTNKNNPWYFKKAQGSWSDGKWTVFWYGVSDTATVTRLINYALSLPDSFLPDNHNNTTHIPPQIHNNEFVLNQVQAVYL